MTLQQRLHGQNYKRLARLSGFTVQTVSRIANGQIANPKPFTIQSIEGAFERISKDGQAGFRKNGRPPRTRKPNDPTLLQRLQRRSATQVSRVSGLSQSYVSLIKRDLNTPTPAYAQKLRCALDTIDADPTAGRRKA